MPKPRIKLPETFHFETSLNVRIDDINYGNHLSNDRLLSLAFEARIQFYQHFKLSELNIGGCGTIISYANIHYRAEARQGDKLSIKIAARDFTKHFFELAYEVRNIDTGVEVARIETGTACYDYEKKKLALVPDSFCALFKA